jgi:hypothetical protein
MALPHFKSVRIRTKSAVGNFNASRMPPKFFAIGSVQALKRITGSIRKGGGWQGLSDDGGKNAKAGDSEAIRQLFT